MHDYYHQDRSSAGLHHPLTRDNRSSTASSTRLCPPRRGSAARFKHGNRPPTPAPSTAGPSTTPWLLKIRTRKAPATKDLQLQRLPRPEEDRASAVLPRLPVHGSLNWTSCPSPKFLGEIHQDHRRRSWTVPGRPGGTGGASTYVYEGNWKLQAESNADGYHVTRHPGTTPPLRTSASMRCRQR